MKKLIAFMAVGFFVFWLSGCNPIQTEKSPVSLPSVIETTEISSIIEPTNVDSSMYAIVLSPTKETVAADDGTCLFSLSFQSTQILLQNQALEERIIGDLQTRTAPVLSYAEQIEAQAHLDYTGDSYWSEYFIDISYTPTRLDQAVLSLFGNAFSYSGGPHPSLMTTSVNYDLQTGDVMFLDDILTPECSSDTLYQMVLNSLSDQADELYYDYADALGDRFTGELHSIQDWYFSRNGLCFHFAPYDIAPYSSGTIIAELPYHSLTGILKEQYLPQVPLEATGSMYAETYLEDDSERLTFIAHVPLVANGTEVLLYPDASVTDLRIETGTLYSDSNQYIPGATVFAANIMNVGDAIRLTADWNEPDTLFRLIYRSNDQEFSAFITYDDIGDSILLTNN